jgi:RNA polymerase sigma-70 factor (ECF subfamily)
MNQDVVSASAPSTLPDEAIVDRIRAGETALFEILMRRHNERLFRAARAILKDEVEAEDVMQDAYVRAFTRIADFEGRARFSTWLTKIAVHEALARRRKNGRFAAELDEDATAAPDDPERELIEHEVRGSVERAVDALPTTFRTVFMLRAVEEMSTAETAECLDIPEETVKTRLFRARGLLRRHLLAEAEATLPGVFQFLRPRCDRVVANVFHRLGIEVAS